MRGVWCSLVLVLATPAGAEDRLDAAATDQTESPFTVGPGRFQIETATLARTWDARDGGGGDVWRVLETTLRIGLWEGIDGEVFFQPYRRVGERDGFGNLTLRGKWNLWGDRPEPWETSFGVLPFLGIPTGGEAGRHQVEGGVALPAAWRVGPDLDLNGMLQVATVRDDAGGGHDVQLQHTLELAAGPPPMGPFSTYLEYAGTVGVEGGTDYVAQLATGLTLAVGADAAFDVGVILGLTDAAPVATAAANLTLRF